MHEIATAVRPVVVNLADWGRRESALMALLSLRSHDVDAVVAVGDGVLPDELVKAAADRPIVHVTEPLYRSDARRLPDVRLSGDPVALAWSFALLEALSTRPFDRNLKSVEFPSHGALAFSFLQDIACRSRVDRPSVRIRFDGLTAIEAARKGFNLIQEELAISDLERSCLEQSNSVLFANDQVAESVSQFFAPSGGCRIGSRQVLPRPAAVEVDSVNRWSGIACVGSEVGTLRQALRGICGFLMTAPHVTMPVEVIAEEDVWEECRGIVPNALLERIRRHDGPLPSLPEMLVVLPDSWGANALAAMELQAMRCGLIVNTANPAFCLRNGWEPGVCVLGYDGLAFELFQQLSEAFHWRAATRLEPACFDEAPEMSCLPGQDAPVAVFARKVSVVVPCYNMGEWLPDTLWSLDRSDFPDLQIIVVDDGSDDEKTRELLEELERGSSPARKVVRLPFNQGLAAARNAGFRHADGEYVICIDADDMLAAGFMQIAVRILDFNSHISFVAPRAAYFEAVDSSREPRLGRGHGIPLAGNAFDSGVFSNMFSTATCLVRRRVWECIQYDENLRSYEDWQWYRRSLLAGHRFIVTNDVHLFYRHRADSMVHDPEMREKHSRLYAEMNSSVALAGRPATTSFAALGVLAAPAGVAGSRHGLLLSRVTDRLLEMQRLRDSRIVGFAYRVSAALHWLLRRR